MARCPFGPHKLSLSDEMECKRCGGDLRFYVAVRDLPLIYYNEARRLWDCSELEEAAAWLHIAVKLSPGLAEAHWLLGAIEARRNHIEKARHHLQKAQKLGAKIAESLLVLVGEQSPANEELVEAPVKAVKERVELMESEIVGVNKSIEPAGVEVRTSRTFLIILKKFFAVSIEPRQGRQVTADSNDVVKS